VKLVGAVLAMDGYGNVALRLSSAVAASGTVTLSTRVTAPAGRAAGHRPRHGAAKTKTVTLGLAHLTLAAGSPTRVEVHLGASAQALVRKAGHLKGTATTIGTATGESKTAAAAITIRAPKPKLRPRHSR
jgi:hypothetical protein